MTLEQILTQVAAGTLNVDEAARLIRRGPPRPPQGRRPPLGAVLLLAVLAIVFLGIGGGMGMSSSRFAAAAARAQGTVIQMVRTGNKGTTAPVVRFAVDGKTYEFQSSIASSPPAYTVGEVVTVLFPPGHPDKGQIDSFTEQWLMPLIFAGVGVVLTIIAIGLGVTRQRRGPPRPALAAPPGLAGS